VALTFPPYFSLPSSEGAYKASIEDREQIFGPNVVSRRPIKSLRQSFSKFRAIFHQFRHSNFMAYSAIVSLAPGLFQDFGTTRHAGQPPVDWANPQHVGIFSITRVLGHLGSGHHLSKPPPRPAPCTAPSASAYGIGYSAPMATVKTVRRNLLARRALRLSLGQLATAQSLPHANDDHPSSASTSRSHSWSTSVDSVLYPVCPTDMPSVRHQLDRRK
jgi:hypothetical protein